MAKQAKAVAKSQKTVQKKPAGKPVQAAKAVSSTGPAKKAASKAVAGKSATPPAKGALKAATRAVKAVADQVAKKIPSVLKSAPAKAGKATPAKSAVKPSPAKASQGSDSAKNSAAPKAAEKKATAAKAAVVQTQVAVASSSASLINGKPLTVGTKASPLVKGKVVGARSSGRLSRQDAGDVCRELACEMLATSATYCRMHYIKNWKRIKAKEVLLQEGKLDRYIGELVAKYPDKYLEAIRQDLQSDRDFLKVVRDLEIVDTSLDEDEVAVDSDSSPEAEPYMGSMRRDFVAEDADF